MCIMERMTTTNANSDAVASMIQSILEGLKKIDSPEAWVLQELAEVDSAVWTIVDNLDGEAQ